MRKIGIILALLVLMCACGCAVTDSDGVATNTTTAVTATTTIPSGAKRTVSLNIPDEIVIEACFSSALDLTIRPNGEHSICFYSEQHGEKIVELSDQDIEEMNALYASITDYTNLPEVDEGSCDVTLTDDGQTHRFCSIFTTQVELEQFIGLLQAHYRGEDYDWETAAPMGTP